MLSRALLLLLTTFSIHSQETYKIALGSCLHQDHPAPIWDAVKDNNIDSFFFLGDNIYGDVPSGLPWKLKRSYDKQKKVLPSWLMSKQIHVIWDDHDYGKNDGGGSYRFKEYAQDLYIDFWEIPDDDPRANREGIYYQQLQNINGLRVLFVGLDTRYFRSNIEEKDDVYLPNLEPDATFLGDKQWEWLKDTLKQEHDLLIMASSIQVLATEHRFEKWSNIPSERNKLLTLLESLDSRVIVVSGDRHRAGLYQYNDITEITASSLNRPTYSEETDSLLLGKTYTENNFGLISIEKDIVEISVINVDNKTLESIILEI
ncbi:MAG: phosphatase [Gammaproteobacteria bacterium]|nr:phosphatase [Gammaproteobacteria bacterium]